MIQTIQTIDIIDKRILSIQFYIIDRKLGREEQKYLQVDSHGLSYLHAREQFESIGDVMGINGGIFAKR